MIFASTFWSGSYYGHKGHLHDPPNSGTTLMIAGVDHSGLLDVPVVIDRTITQRHRLSCRLVDKTASVTIDQMSRIVFVYQGTLVFAGSVFGLTEGVPQDWGKITTKFIDLECVDRNEAADRRTVTRRFDDPTKTAGSMIRQVVADVLRDENIADDNVRDGPTLDATITFSREYPSRIFDRLALQAGYLWWIDYAGVLNFVPTDETTAPFSIDETTAVAEIRRRGSRSKYRNTQIIDGGRFVGFTQPPLSFKGDGINRTFSVREPIGEEPTVTLNGAAQTVGILGVDTTEDWFWSKGSEVVSQKDSGTVLTASDTLTVTYKPLRPLVTKATDQAEVKRQKGITGGSGIFEATDSDGSIDDIDLASDKAAALLAKFAQDSVIVECRAVTKHLPDALSLVPGMTQTLNVPTLNLSGDYLVQRVSLRSLERKLGHWEVSWTLVNVDDRLGGLRSFIQRLLGERLNEPSFESEEVLNNITSGAEQVTVSTVGTASTGNSLDAYTLDPRFFVVGIAVVGKSKVGVPENI